MSLLNALKVLPSAEGYVARPAQIPMAQAQQDELTIKLKENSRANVYPNGYDVNRPFSVRIKVSGKYQSFGSFTNVHVATYVGALCAMSVYGLKAVRGIFDEAIAENHEEFKTWEADERNQEVIAKVQAIVSGKPTAPAANQKFKSIAA